VEQALGGTCPSVCNSSVACSTSCTVDSAQGQQTLNCGQYGSCKPPASNPPPVLPGPCDSSWHCPASQCCIEFGRVSQNNVVCLRCL
jgi:hypothetical protein